MMCNVLFSAGAAALVSLALMLCMRAEHVQNLTHTHTPIHTHTINAPLIVACAYDKHARTHDKLKHTTLAFRARIAHIEHNARSC